MIVAESFGDQTQFGVELILVKVSVGMSKIPKKNFATLSARMYWPKLRILKDY